MTKTVLICSLLCILTASIASAGKYSTGVDLSYEPRFAYRPTMVEATKSGIDYRIYDFDPDTRKAKLELTLLGAGKVVDCQTTDNKRIGQPVKLVTPAGVAWEVPIYKVDNSNDTCWGYFDESWLDDWFEIRIPVVRGHAVIGRFKTDDLDLMKLVPSGKPAERHEVLLDQNCTSDFDCPGLSHCSESKGKCATMKMGKEGE